MWRYSTIFVNGISFAISIVIFIIINSLSCFMEFNPQLGIKSFNNTIGVKFQVNAQKEKQQDIENYEICNNNMTNSKEGEIDKLFDSEDNDQTPKWYLEIPIIGLKQEIKEGTSFELMNEAIGHFEETPKIGGTIGLAAHNRGCKKNYFKDLKKLKEKDLIIYNCGNFQKKYRVTKHIIIKDTDWSELAQNDEERLTLITCVENQPEYRRCVQAKESEE